MSIQQPIKINKLRTILCVLILLFSIPASATISLEQQKENAKGVVSRLLGENLLTKFDIQIIDQEDGLDVFEVDYCDGKIVLRGSSGVSICRGLKWYLNNLCNCSVSWRGDNLDLPDPLPIPQGLVREKTQMKYRYFLNNCVYGYSMAYWKWPQWERMLDIMAINGIDLPLCLLGQEKVWQLTYNELGLENDDLDDFFAGPAWFPWQWMGNLDGWGGPLPQSMIDGQSELQKLILKRARGLGMKPILSGFSGHIPKALKRKYPNIITHNLSWWGFSTTLLDWQDPLFFKIGTTFLQKQQEIYGTDHYYSIDPFNEMNPPSTELSYIDNMARSIFSSINAADPKGKWVLMTWFCKSPHLDWNYWKVDRTKTFFDAIPDNRLLALELHGDDKNWTGWFRQNGWYGKEWVWCAIQNFGDKVDIYGGLEAIFDNYNMMRESSEKGNIKGMGIAMEGLCYNPVIFELLFDMMWSEGVVDMEKWKQDYIIKRYGKKIAPVVKAWDILYRERYLSPEYTGYSALCSTPKLIDDSDTDVNIAKAWELMLEASDVLCSSQTYHFDLVNISREAMGGYAVSYISKVKEAYESKDLDALKKASSELIIYIRDFDKLMGTSEHFLLGKWIEGFRSWGENEQEKKLFEWNAKRQITDWGGDIGYYAIKEWSGYMVDFILPQWEIYLKYLESNLLDNPVTPEDVNADMADFRTRWYKSHSGLPVEPQGNPIEVSKQMWDKYGVEMLKQVGGGEGLSTPAGIVVGKPVEASGVELHYKPEFAVDNNLSKQSCWWAPAPAWLTVDIGRVESVFGFQVYPYWGDDRYYQYTISTSLDGVNWSQIIDMSENTEKATAQGHLHKFKVANPDGVKARYVRLNMIRNNVNSSVHVIEFKVFDSEIDF